MKYFFVVGEASGDMHAARLISELKKQEPNSQFFGWGGDDMQKVGAQVLKHISELAFMGFAQVILNIRTILNNFKLIKKQITEAKPDAIVLVDYPGFNLRLAKWAKAEGYTVIYYIAPQAWAWKENRVEKLKKYTDKLICILPFEKQFFDKHGMVVDYVGHPLLEQIKIEERTNEKIIALLPGSRAQEVKTMLPIMLEVIENFPDFEFHIAQSPNLNASFYGNYSGTEKVKLHTTGVSSLLKKSQAALVTSGTATLETALYEVPQIVCYKSGALSYAIAKRLIKVPYISLVNLIADKEVVTELIQNNLNRKRLTSELKKLLAPASRNKMLTEYKSIKTTLGEGGASGKVAKIISDYLKNKR